VIVLLLVAISFFFYLITMAPTVLWGDSAKLALYAYQLNTIFDPVGGHHLHSYLGHLFGLLPFEHAYTQNLMSGVFGAIGIGLLFCVLSHLSGSRRASFWVSASVAVSHTWWLSSVINESYTLTMCLLLGAWLCCLKARDMFSMKLVHLGAFLVGLSLTNSMLPLVLLPFYGWWIFAIAVLSCYRLWPMFTPIYSFALGLTPLVFAYVVGEGHWILTDYLYWASHDYFKPMQGLSRLWMFMGYLAYNFPGLGLLIGLVGSYKMARSKPHLWATILITLLIFTVFAMGYTSSRRHFLLMPSYLLFSVWIVYAIRDWDKLHINAAGVLLVILPLFTYYIVPVYANAFGANIMGARELPLRNNNRFYLLPDKGKYIGAYSYGLEALLKAEWNAHIISDFTPGIVLKYLQAVKGWRPDVTVDIVVDYFIHEYEGAEEIEDYVGRHIDEGPLYFADFGPYYFPERLEGLFVVEKEGMLWRVRRR